MRQEQGSWPWVTKTLRGLEKEVKKFEVKQPEIREKPGKHDILKTKYTVCVKKEGTMHDVRY